jgi:hypothetical protein
LAATPLDLGPAEPDPQRQWTVMVYLDADNDLEPFALRDLNEMESGLPGSGVEVVVLIDRAKGYDEGFENWTDARIYRLRGDHDAETIASELLASPGELNMGDPATLAGFVGASMRRFPAKQYALVLWDHGGGWLHLAIDHDAPGSAEGHDGLSVPELGQALRQALSAGPVERLDLVGFDMCLMAQLETAYEVAPLADVMVASQAVEPGEGWPYDRILPAFGKGTLGSRRLAAQIVDAYRAFYESRQEHVATQSAIDLSAVSDVVKALDGIANKIAAKVPEAWPQISRSLFFAESYSDRTDIRKAAEALSSADLLDTLKRLRLALPEFPAQQEFADLVTAMDRAVLANYASARHRLSHGLAFYAPVTGRQFNAAYETTRLARESAWPRLLGTVHGAQQAHLTAPRITGLQVVDAQSGAPLSEVKPGGGVALKASIEGENVLWVHALHAIYDPENKGHLVLEKGYVWDPEYYNKQRDATADVVDLVMPEFRGKRNTVSQEFTGFHLSVTDGKTAARATVDGSSLTDLQHLAVPVLIKNPEIGEFFATVFFDGITWDAVSVVAEIPQPDGSVAYRQIQPQASDQVTLLFELIPDGGGDSQYLRGETLQWSQGLELLVSRDEPSELVVALQAESIGGMSDFAAVPLKIVGYTEQEQQFIENAGKLTRQDLVGTWQWHGLKDGSWQAIPPYTEIQPLEGNPEVLVARTFNPSDPDWKVDNQAVLLDTRLMPALRLISFDPQGTAVEAMNFTVLVSRWDQNGPRMILKYLVPKGWLILWAKQGAAAAPGVEAPTTATLQPPPAPGSNPLAVPPPPPQPAVSLVGYWQSDEGEILALDEHNYALYEYNQLVDGGTYSIQGATLTARSQADGGTETYRFQSDGTSLLLQDSDGDVWAFRRKQ